MQAFLSASFQIWNSSILNFGAPFSTFTWLGLFLSSAQFQIVFGFLAVFLAVHAYPMSTVPMLARLHSV